MTAVEEVVGGETMMTLDVTRIVETAGGIAPALDLLIVHHQGGIMEIGVIETELTEIEIAIVMMAMTVIGIRIGEFPFLSSKICVIRLLTCVCLFSR